ncbi:sensor histidine kinase [Chloroflexota bacterium]
MSASVRILRRNIDFNLVYNPHFWIIAFLYVCILFLYYYLGIFPIDNRLQAIWRYTLFEYKYGISGILFLIPFTYAVIIYWWRGALIAWSVTLIAALPRIIYLSFDLVHLLTNIFYIVFPLLVIVFTTLQLRWREKERTLNSIRITERQAYTLQILKAQEEERHRISRELHDETAQSLVSLGMDIDSLTISNKELPEITLNYLVDLRNRTDEILSGVRNLSINLRPPMLKEFGLVPALKVLSKNLANKHALKTIFRSRGDVQRLPLETELTLFRVVQEALNNVGRHAQATKAVISIKFASNEIKIQISDNGKGFEVPDNLSVLTKSGKLGLAGMRERATLMDGTFHITSALSKGTTLTILIHMEHSQLLDQPYIFT